MGRSSIIEKAESETDQNGHAVESASGNRPRTRVSCAPHVFASAQLRQDSIIFLVHVSNSAATERYASRGWVRTARQAVESQILDFVGLGKRACFDGLRSQNPSCRCDESTLSSYGADQIHKMEATRFGTPTELGRRDAARRTGGVS
jgi:hypothetical protein